MRGRDRGGKGLFALGDKREGLRGLGKAGLPRANQASTTPYQLWKYPQLSELENQNTGNFSSYDGLF